MTREHIPAESAGNGRPVRLVDRPFDPEPVLREVAAWGDGHVVSTLCRPCNGRASWWGYVREYTTWRNHFIEEARAFVQRTNRDPLRGLGPFDVTLGYGMHPARFVRQVVGMFLAVQESEHLFATYPHLPTLIGPDTDRPTKGRAEGLPLAPLHLYLSVCNSPFGIGYNSVPMMALSLRNPGARQALWTPPGAGHARRDDQLVLVANPFAFVLTTAESNGLGRDISEWAQWSINQCPRRDERGISLPTEDHLDGALRAMIYPDYVTR
jgi:hypothetical protein